MSRYLFLLLLFIGSFPPSAISSIGSSTNLDSLKQLLASTNTPLEIVKISAQIAEAYSLTRVNPDSTIVYRDYAYTALNENTDRTTKEESYVIIIEAMILEMNLDSFAHAALEYIENPEQKIKVYLVLGNGYYFSKTDYDKQWCLAVMDTIADLLEQAPNESLRFQYEYSCAFCHLDLGKTQLLPALERLLTAESMLKADYRGAAQVYDALAYVYQGLAAYELALTNAKKGRALAQKKQAYFDEGRALSAMMEAAFSLKEYPLVKTYAQAFIELEQVSPSLGIVRPYYYLGKTALAEKQTAAAKQYFQTGLQALGPSTKVTDSQIHQGLSQAWFLEGNLARAKQHADTAMSIFSYDHMPTLKGRYRAFAKIYAAEKKYQAAYELIARDLQEVEVKDSLNNPYDIISTLLNQNFEQEKTILDNQIQQRNQLLWWALALSLGVIAAAIVFYRNSLVRKRLADKIQAQNQAILAAQDQLIVQEKLASLGQLATGIAHEIKNPLNFINNFAEGSTELHQEVSQLMNKGKAKLTVEDHEEVQELLKELSLNVDEIKAQGERVDKIIRNMMEHSRGEAGEQFLTDLNLLLEDNANLAYHGFRSLEPAFQVHYDWQLAANIPQISIYRQEISRVLLNILNNASYAVFQKQKQNIPNYKPTIQLNTRLENEEIILTIKDNGIGIKEDLMDQIFNPFFTTKPPNGVNTGLGLYISYDIVVQQHHGQLKVLSEMNQFTSFSVHLPLKK